MGSEIKQHKSYLATWALALFLGFFGADRFYLGKNKSAIAKILTAGGFGIWYLIDVVLVLTGKTKDSHGQNLESSKGQRIGALAVTFLIALFVLSVPREVSTRDVQGEQEVKVVSPSPSVEESIVVQPSSSPTISQSSSPSPSPNPSTNDTAAGKEAFAFYAHRELDDMLKDLDDMKARAKERSSLRLMGNLIEIMWNKTMLEDLTPPSKIAEQWFESLTKLDAQRDILADKISAFVGEEITLSQMQKAISEFRSAVLKIDSLASKVG